MKRRDNDRKTPSAQKKARRKLVFRSSRGLNRIADLVDILIRGESDEKALKEMDLHGIYKKTLALFDEIENHKRKIARMRLSGMAVDQLERIIINFENGDISSKELDNELKKFQYGNQVILNNGVIEPTINLAAEATDPNKRGTRKAKDRAVNAAQGVTKTSASTFYRHQEYLAKYFEVLGKMPTEETRFLNVLTATFHVDVEVAKKMAVEFQNYIRGFELDETSLSLLTQLKLMKEVNPELQIEAFLKDFIRSHPSAIRTVLRLFPESVSAD